MSRVWTAAKLLAALGAVGALLFVGASLLFQPSGHEGDGTLADNPASRAIRNIFDDDDAVIDAVQAAHEEFNAQIWGDGGDLTSACSSLEEAVTAAGDADTYDEDQVGHLHEVRGRVCDGDGSDLALHDALVDLEEDLRGGGR